MVTFVLLLMLPDNAKDEAINGSVLLVTTYFNITYIIVTIRHFFCYQ